MAGEGGIVVAELPWAHGRALHASPYPPVLDGNATIAGPYGSAIVAFRILA